MKNRFYSLAEDGKAATLDIFGDISSFADKGSGASVSDLTSQLAKMGDVETIAVNINSYGGEVAEGLAIYNALRSHKAKVTTRCSGFACSIASVIFMAGEERIMDEASLLMIHNAWTVAEGNAADLRKQAEDLEKITDASVKAYLSRVNISEEELRAMMDAETWLDPETAKEHGFCTAVEKHETDNPSQNARKKVQQMILMNPYQAFDDEETEEPENPETEETPEEPTEPENDGETEEEEPLEAEDEENPEEEEEPEQEFPEDEETEDEAVEKQCAFFRAVMKM